MALFVLGCSKPEGTLTENDRKAFKGSQDMPPEAQKHLQEGLARMAKEHAAAKGPQGKD
jgi:hypothetical protein